MGTTPADYIQITDTVTGLFIAIDEKDWPAVRACFADVVLFDLSSATGSPASTVTSDSIVAGWKQELAPIQAIHHQVGNSRVRVEGNGADVFCYGIVFHYLPTLSGKDTRMLVASYDLHLIRGGDGWLIDAFRLTAKFADGNLALEKS